MAKYSKWLGAGVGWVLGGPIGALLGFAAGAFFDETGRLPVTQNRNRQNNFPDSDITDASVSLLVLAAAVIRADKKVKIAELNYVRSFFISQYGIEFTERRMLILNNLVRQQISVRQVCMQITANTTQAVRLQLIHFLFGIAKADAEVTKEESDVIQSAAFYLNINDKDFESIKAMFYVDADKFYKILEINKTATDDEVKKAYRKMAMKYHPDKVAGQGEEFEKAAKSKFQQVNEAFLAIKKERNFA